MAPHLTLYLDPTSPFAYISLHLLLTRTPFSTTPLTVVPVFLGGIMAATSNRPPLTVPTKSAYLELDRKRLCRRFSIPFRKSPLTKFPINTLAASRIAVAMSIAYSGSNEEVKRFMYELCKAQWVEEEVDIEDLQVVGRLVEKVVGKEGREKVESVMREKAAEVKEGLKKNTEDAVGRGAFGVPWIVVRDEEGREDVVWGVDHLDVVAEMLGGVWPPPVGKKGEKAVL